VVTAETVVTVVTAEPSLPITRQRYQLLLQHSLKQNLLKNLRVSLE
jgi:hypothetical protein